LEGILVMKNQGDIKALLVEKDQTVVASISDLPTKEVDERAEGYGILGHVSRSIPSKDLTLLIEHFEEISQSIHLPKT
jgi:hypothetical protein